MRTVQVCCVLVGGDRLSADRRLDHEDPSFPVLRGLGFVVGLQEQPAAIGASPLLALQLEEAPFVDRWCPASSTQHPVGGSAGVVW